MPVSSDAPRPLRILAVVAIVVMLALGGVATYLQVQNSSTLEQQRRSDELNGCRAAWQLKLVAGPTFRGLKAIALNDPAALHRAVEQGDPDRYEQLVTQSRLHPDAFLRDCRRRFP